MKLQNKGVGVFDLRMNNILKTPHLKPNVNDAIHTSDKQKTTCIIPALLACFILLAGCAAINAQELEENNKINGEVPKAPTKKLAVENAGLRSYVQGNDEYILIEPGHRDAGTRSPVHTHPNSGATCVIQGEMTLILEGKDDQTFYGDISKGKVNCYSMPKPEGGDENKMSAENTGSGPALIIDIFPIPNTDYWQSFDPMCVLQTGNPDGYVTGSGCEEVYE